MIDFRWRIAESDFVVECFELAECPLCAREILCVLSAFHAFVVGLALVIKTQVRS